ncbi:hypothetical protein [Streptomyces tailanensis]|uniref:hypothetical protein n=1 Tax=Streptomyces tailanensis TaxID=2569858 RepID=UPI00122DED84|nr:hypothetical protein [Streptomyces tailanensis]
MQILDHSLWSHTAAIYVPSGVELRAPGLSASGVLRKALFQRDLDGEDNTFFVALPLEVGEEAGVLEGGVVEEVVTLTARPNLELVLKEGRFAVYQ